MPLPTPSNREQLTNRTISCNGYLRSDGLMDIEGRLVDVRGYDTPSEWRGAVRRGEPVHEMWLRLTINDDLVIQGVECATDASPHPSCRNVPPNLQRLLGLAVAGGFKKQVRERVGGTEGCTHILALIDVMSSVAVHALAGKRRDLGKEVMLGTYGRRDGQSHPLVDSCHAYAADGPVVKAMWPQFYRPKVEPTSK